MRQTLVLLVASCVAFTLAAMWLSGISTRSSNIRADSQAVRVVQAHFEALHRGDFHAAYALFSARLRRQLPFEEFHEMMLTHIPMLRGRVSVVPETTTANRIVVNIDFSRSGDMGLTAEFTLVRNNGRWWIDDVHWGLERLRPEHLDRA